MATESAEQEPGYEQVQQRDRLRLGYACAWWHPREQTWSYSAVRLREALATKVAIADLEAQRSIPGKIAMRAMYAWRRDTPWKYSALERALVDRAVRTRVSETRPDVVLGIAEVDTPTIVPTFLFQDTNVAAVLEYQRTSGRSHTNLQPARRQLLERWAETQGDRARQATGVFATSEWFATFLIEHQGVSRERVSVVPAGLNNPPSSFRDPEQPARGRVLFVGTDFLVKGGDIVVEAVRRLRSGAGFPATLTIAGPSQWPLPGAIPPWIDFRGRLAPQEVASLYAAHDVLAMPSRFEGFGIAVAEALVAGLPCVGRRAFAMPEIISPGVTGALVESDDPDELACALDRLLGDTGVFARVAMSRTDLLERFSWGTAATSIVDRIQANIS